jgi:hypothetical protein
MQRAKPLPKLPVPEGAADSDASSIGLKELVVDDLEITRMYRELAARHDALVDAVLEKLKEQAAGEHPMPSFIQRLIGE